MKKIIILAVCAGLVSGCKTSSGDQKPIVESKPIKAATKEVTQPTTKVVYTKRARKTYKSIKPVTSTSVSQPKKTNTLTPKQKAMLADMRGVASDDIYEQLEKTQAENPIKGYNNINTDDLKNVAKDSDMAKPVETTKKMAKKQTGMLNKGELIGISEAKALEIMVKPNNIFESNQITLWEYKNETCKAVLYFFAGGCSFIETEGYGDTSSCLDSFKL